MRAHFPTILVLIAIAAVAHTGGCVDVTPYPAIDAASGMGAVLECVTARGGSIRFESESGQGTTWAFSFPVAMLMGDDARLSIVSPVATAALG